MPGAGTDKTRRWIAEPGPVFVLVEPQLGENIGAAARAMSNFSLARLRLVAPQQGWPNEKARMMAAGADRVLEAAALYPTLADAIADCRYVVAATARAHDQAKPVIGPQQAAELVAPRVSAGDTVAYVFGRERNGLENDEVGLADAVVTLPVNPAFASLNLAQAVAILAYEWFKTVSGGVLPFAMPDKSPPARKEQLLSFFRTLEAELEKIEYFRPDEKRETMVVNMRNIFNRMQASQQDIRTLHGIVTALAEGRKGPARGGVLDGEQAELLRALIADRPPAAPAESGGPPRGLARLLRRNPTEAERLLWQTLTRDRRLIAAGFKRQTPVGPHIADIVSFTHRIVIDLVPAGESAETQKARAERNAWFAARDYRVVAVPAAGLEAAIGAVLDRLAEAVSPPPASKS